MTISIIIPTYNEADVLTHCLKSLTKQSFGDFEVIIVDDGSLDNTIRAIDGIKHQTLNIKYLTQSHLGAGAARNLGAKHAKGKILVFVDADMTFDRDFLKNLTSPIQKNVVKGTFSKDEFVSNWDNPWSRCWNVNQGWVFKRRHKPNYPDRQPVFRAILKSEFNKVGGFTPGGYDDDWSLSRKLGYEAEAAKNTIFYHKNPDNLKEIFEHAKWVGKRKYKLGLFGYLFALARASVPISIIAVIVVYFRLLFEDYALFKSTRLYYPIFKIVYDFGLMLGILNYLFTGKSSK